MGAWVSQTHCSYLEVHLDRLVDNYKFLRALKGHQKFLCPMIKANAYGHGDLALARVLEDCGSSVLGVANTQEGVLLRDKGIFKSQILVFGFHGVSDAKEIAQSHLTPVVSSQCQWENLLEVRRDWRIHLKLNTGMNRLGFRPEEMETLRLDLMANRGVQVEGICTHLHSGENLNQPKASSYKQVELFKKMVCSLGLDGVIQHIYNSGAIASLHKHQGRFEYGLRPGLLIYGVDPSGLLSLKPKVQPLLELKSKVVSLQRVPKGEVVSYGGFWKAPRDSVVGIVPMGYAQGLRRSLSHKKVALIQGLRHPICGLVCMDYVMVDVTWLYNERSRELVNQEVVFIGNQGGNKVTIEEMAEQAGCSVYEIMTGLSPNLPRFYRERKDF